MDGRMNGWITINNSLYPPSFQMGNRHLLPASRLLLL